jgi:hypothetical protein
VTADEILVQLVHATTGESREVRMDCPRLETEPRYQVNALLSDSEPIGDAYVWIDGRRLHSLVTLSPQVPPTTYDVLAAHGLDLLRLPASRMALLRDVVVAGDMDIAIDFRQGFVPVRRTLRADNASGSLEVELRVLLHTPNALSAEIGLVSFRTEATFDFVPDEQLRPEDLYELHALERGGNATTGYFAREVVRFVSRPGDLTLLLPPMPRLMRITVPPSGEFRPVALLQREPSGTLYTVSYQQNGPPRLRWMLHATSAWLETANTFEAPDLSTVPMWQREWSLQRATTTWRIRAAAADAAEMVFKAIGLHEGGRDGISVDFQERSGVFSP